MMKNSLESFVLVGRGRFICIEGLDASGKTTQAKRLVESLRSRGFASFYTTEPSSGEVGRLVRRFVLDRRKRVPFALEALLFAADRIDHVEKEIRPSMKQGKVIVCDRYVFSSLAYQGAAGLDLRWIERINRFALVPDLALFLDVWPRTVVKRLLPRARKSVMETLENQRRVREVYLKMVDDGRLVRIEGNRSKDHVATEVLNVVLDFLGRPDLDQI